MCALAFYRQMMARAMAVKIVRSGMFWTYFIVDSTRFLSGLHVGFEEKRVTKDESRVLT